MASLWGLVFAAAICGTVGHKEYQGLIPNGDKIPHPCGGGAVWSGVGHLKPGGGGARNQFGIDFESSSKRWTRELCQKDSDGDGRTNGEELGDPGCTWVQGSVLSTSIGISHPGICEPVASSRCQAYNKQFGTSLSCGNTDGECPATKEPGTMQHAARFPVTPVPAKITNYFCMLFELPSDGDYHLVATTPIVNNSNMLHHMILFGCELPDSDEVMKSVDANKNKPYECGMSPHKYCQQIIGTWTLGSRGDCVSRNAGFRIGTRGYRVAALQIHWNNRQAQAGQMDSSGMNLYYTASRRVHDAAVFVVGQEFLAIPPRAKNSAFEAKCPSDCTEQMFNQTVYVTRAVNHMHYFGQSQVVTLYRDGKKLRELTNDQKYDYDNPIFHHFDPPVVMEPGDEIRTRCVYNSNSSQVTYFGAGTDDEMCYAFLTYYPSHHLPPTLCASWKNVQRCHRYLEKFGGMLGDCRWRSLVHLDVPENKRVVQEYYAPDTCGSNLKDDQCSENCTRASRELGRHPCLQAEVGEWVRYKMRTNKHGQVFLNRLKTCGAFSNRGDFVRSSYITVLSIVIVLMGIGMS